MYHAPVLSAYGQPPRVHHGYGASPKRRVQPQVLRTLQGLGTTVKVNLNPTHDPVIAASITQMLAASVGCQKAGGVFNGQWDPNKKQYINQSCIVPASGNVGGGTPTNVGGGVPTWAYIAGGMVLVGGAAWYFLK